MRAMGYPIPKHRTERNATTGERRETTNDESLQELLRDGKPAAGDMVLSGVLDARHLSKAVSYLSGKYVHPDGRMHPIYTSRPEARLASASPNVMNFPKGKRGEIIAEAAEEILGSIVADAGYTIVMVDWNSLHPTLIAQFAGDPQYARVARLGDHAYVLSHYLTMKGKRQAPCNLSKSDEDVLAELNELKKTYPREYLTCKTANLAYKYMQGVDNMARGTGLSHSDTKDLRDAIDAASPQVMAWKWRTLMQAHSEKRLVSPFGLSRSFFDVFKARGGKIITSKREKNELFPDGLPILGSEAHQVVSYLPLATESGMLRETLVALDSHEECWNTFDLLMPEHDKIIVQVRDGEVDRIVKDVLVPTMGRAWPELGGLVVGTDVEIGKVLGKVTAWKAGAND